ncbi:MAG: hypothetical protein AB1510_05450 [Bacillota bacterium]
MTCKSGPLPNPTPPPRSFAFRRIRKNQSDAGGEENLGPPQPPLQNGSDFWQVVLVVVLITLAFNGNSMGNGVGPGNGEETARRAMRRKFLLRPRVESRRSALIEHHAESK